MKNKDISNFEDLSQFRYLDSHMIRTVLLDFDICTHAENVIHIKLRKKDFFALDRFNRESAIDITKTY